MKLKAREEDTGFYIGVLVRLENISAVAEDEIRNARNQALLVGTGNEQCDSFSHGRG